MPLRSDSATSTAADPPAADRGIRPASMQELLARQRAAFLHDGVPDARVREERIARLQALILDNADELVAAISHDFGTRPSALSRATDIGSVGDLSFQKKHVAQWMNPQHPGGRIRCSSRWS